jgi:NAD(P)-dependent dehydrogenase (short-subunit alcohol dehydrogenase family)
MGKLARKVALITGAGSGIGRASAILFAQEGARVSVVDYAREAARETASEIKKAKGEAIFIRADVSRAADVTMMVERTVSTFGRLDILYNNAGISPKPGARIADFREDEWDSIMDTNLKSAFLASKHAIPIMVRQGGGVILSTSSVNGIGAVPTSGAYCVSKAGLILLCKLIAVEYARNNIRANCVCPGMTSTGMTGGLSEIPMDFIPEGRMADPQEIARAALFLASEDASYVNGTCFVVDGGWSAQLVGPVKEDRLKA